MKDFIRDKLRIENNVTTARAHKTGKMKRENGAVNKKRTIVVRFLSYKEKASILTKYRAKQMWN